MDAETSEEPMPAAPVAAAPVALSQLNYAPPVRGARHPVAMFAWGIGTSILAVGVVFLASLYMRTDVLSWQMYYVIPIGALITSIVAALGYVIGARVTGVRMNSMMLVGVLLLQVITYLASEYVQFAPHHYVHAKTFKPVGFFEYLHMKNMSWSSVDSDGSTHALGGLGYLFVSLQVIAFVMVGPLMAGAAVSRSKNTMGYCDICKLYLKRRRIALFPASLPYRKMSNLSPEELAEYRELQQEQILAAADGAEMMLKLAAEGDLQTVRDLANGVRSEQRQIARLPNRLELSVEFCPGCSRTTLRTTMCTGYSRRRRLGECEVSNEFAELATRLRTLT